MISGTRPICDLVSESYLPALVTATNASKSKGRKRTTALPSNTISLSRSGFMRNSGFITSDLRMGHFPTSLLRLVRWSRPHSPANSYGRYLAKIQKDTSVITELTCCVLAGQIRRRKGLVGDSTDAVPLRSSPIQGNGKNLNPNQSLATESVQEKTDPESK